jgi:hypothetical protein
MTDQQRLLVALLSESSSTEADLDHMRMLELIAVVDLVGPEPALRA